MHMLERNADNVVKDFKMIKKEELIEWLKEDGYTHKEATEQILNAIIIDLHDENKYKIIYDNGFVDIIHAIEVKTLKIHKIN